MQDRAAAAADIADFELSLDKLGARELYIASGTAATDRNDRRMLADQDNDAAICVRQSVVGEAPLQRQAVFEIDDSEQVDVDRKFGREPVCGRVQAISHSFSP